MALGFQQVGICDTDLTLEEPRLRAISVRMNYLPAKAAFASTLKNPSRGYVSRCALGRDYHKVLRNRLKKPGDMIREHCEQAEFRPFVDCAPLLERPLAAKAGPGWTGKHSLILNHEVNSWFSSASCRSICRCR